MPLEITMPGASTSHLRSIKGVEIFRAGVWNKDEYAVADLDEMVAAFGDVGYPVPLKLGHDETSGGPAYGWVERVYRVGDVLLADFKDIPSWLFAAITEDHAYDQVSVEIYWNLQRNGKRYKRALKAVALLGAETPAVSGLAPLREAFFAADAYEKVTTATFKATHMPEPVPAVTVQQFTELQAQLRALTEAQAALTTKLAASEAELNAARQRETQLTTTVATLTTAATQSEVAARVASCKLPALHETLRHLYTAALADSGVRKFAENGKVEDRTLTQILDGLVSWANKFAESVVRTGTTQNSRPLPAGGEQAADPSVELRTRTRAYMEEKNVKDYGAAMQSVLRADADLAQRYADFTRGRH